ncbi:MAG TPA: hypothetical protein VGB92_17210 [Longimicrobium sp.]
MRFAPLSSRPPSRLPRAPLVASAVAHAILVVVVARSYHPTYAPTMRPAAPRQEVVWIDFPAPDAVALPGPGGVAGRAQAPGSPRIAPPTPVAAPTTAVETSAAPPAASEAAAGPSAPAAPSRPWSGVRDPRLYVDTRSLAPPPARPDHARLATDFAAAVRTDSVRAAEAARQSLARRQVTVFGRRVTVGGDSAAAGFRTEAIEARRDVLTMPGDRIMWERLELSKQDGQQARDSVFRERVRATRARNDAGRRP